MRLLRWIFLVFFVLGLVYAGVELSRVMPRASELTSAREARVAELESLKEKLGETNIKYRGFLESTSTIPDSLRAAEAGRSMKIQKEFHKKIYKMEMEERELKRLIRKDERALAELYGGMRSRLLVSGGLTVLFLVGAIMAGRAANRT
jgi:hypothetical protein